jgi:hypothetical protein
MSQENVETMRQTGASLQGVDVAPFIRALLDGNTEAIPPEVADGFAALLAIYDPDFEIDTSRVDMPGFGVLHGLEGMRQLWLRRIEEWERYCWTQRNWTERDDALEAVGLSE